MSIDDYEILAILGSNINSTTYKVKHKKHGNSLVWHTVGYEHKSEAEKQNLLDKIRERIEMCHPNIIKFHNYIDEKEKKVLYIVTEYCENGSLKKIIDLCLKGNTRLSEELVCKITYQIALTVKTSDIHTEKLNIKDIFLDKDFNVKLFNFKMHYNTLKPAKMCHLGLILYEICTLKHFTGSNGEYEGFKYLENIFCQSILSLITSLIKDKSDLKKNIDKLLCHPTVLLKSTQWIKEKSFISNFSIEKSEKPPLKDNNTQDECEVHTLKIEKIRIREISLQRREQALNEREYKLTTKEKKISLMERAAKEKLQQAEVYLKRCREHKSVKSENTKSITSIQTQKKTSYENLDSTYVSCGDSILLPTSSKLNVNKIVKPAPFTRTLSERRIRFKGHSPLKEIDFNRRSVKQSKLQRGILLKKNCEWLTCSEDTDKSSIDGSSKGPYNKAKELFSTNNKYEEESVSNDMQCAPITWTEESKKYAFELLRVMNSDKENQHIEVKHTYL